MADVTLNVQSGHEYRMIPRAGGGYYVFDQSSANPTIAARTLNEGDTLVLTGSGGGRLFVQAYGNDVPQIRATSANNSVNTLAALPPQGAYPARVTAAGNTGRPINNSPLPMFNITGGDVIVSAVQANLTTLARNTVQRRTDLITGDDDGQHIRFSDSRHILVQEGATIHVADAGSHVAAARSGGGTVPIAVPPAGRPPETAPVTEHHVQLMTIIGGADNLAANRDRATRASDAAANAISEASSIADRPAPRFGQSPQSYSGAVAGYETQTRIPRLQRLGITLPRPVLNRFGIIMPSPAYNPIGNTSPPLPPLSVDSPIVAMVGDLPSSVLREAVFTARLSGSPDGGREADPTTVQAPATQVTGDPTQTFLV